MFPLPLPPLRSWQTCCSPQMPYQCCHSQRSAGSHVLPSISGLRSDSRCFCGAGPVLLPQRSLPVLFRTGYHSSFAGSLPDWCFCQSWRNRDRSVQWSSDVLLCNSPHTSSVPPDYCRCPGHVNYSEYRRVQAASFLMYSLQNPFPFCFFLPLQPHSGGGRTTQDLMMHAPPSESQREHQPPDRSCDRRQLLHQKLFVFLYHSRHSKKSFPSIGFG